MNPLLHNPIADMYGVDFLLFYCFVNAIAFVVCWQLTQDPTKNQPLPLIPAEPDPYEIAYLRSQETGIANVALFDLIVQGYLEVNEQSISQVPNHPDVSQLQPIEREVFDRLSSSSTAKTSLLLSTESIQLYSNAYEEKLQNEQLLSASQWQERNIKIGLIGAMIIFSLWGYKLLIALGKGGHDENFLTVLIAIGVLSIVFLVGFVSERSHLREHTHLSQRGKVYLQQLQATFSRLQQKVKNEIPSVFDYNLLVALFGVEALAGTSYDSYYKAFFPPTFSRTASRGSRSSGSSSSSSSDSSSGCGSSCSSSSSDSSCSSSSCSSSSDSGSSCSSSSCSSSSCGGGGGCGGG